MQPFLMQYQLYKIRPQKTMPQALLFFVYILMYVVLAINVVLMSLAPQYMMYGNQKYQVSGTDKNCLFIPSYTITTPCLTTTETLLTMEPSS